MIELKRTDREMLLGLITMFGTLKLSQAEQLLSLKYPNSVFWLTLKPLIKSGKLKCDGDYIFSRTGQLDEKYITAVDVMLLIGCDINQPILKGEDIFSLTFFKNKNEKLWRYDVCQVSYGTENVISAKLERINTKYRMIVFLLEKAEQIKGLSITCENCYVLKQNENYEFYLGGKENGI